MHTTVRQQYSIIHEEARTAMDTPHDRHALHDFREELGPRESLTLEKLIRVAGFPVYGLVAYPHGLTLEGFGHCIVDPFVPQSDPPTSSTQSPYLWTVTLSYDFAPAHLRFGQHVELITTNIHRSPMSESTVYEPESEPEARYPSPRDVPPVSALPVSFIVEHLPFAEDEAVATFKYDPRESRQGRLLGTQVHQLPDSRSASAPSPARVVVPSPASPTWSFTLRWPNMRVDGRAWRWTQDDLFAALGQVAAISDRAEIIARYERELLVWRHYFYGDLPSA
jgi:hypothetical protein